MADELISGGLPAGDTPAGSEAAPSPAPAEVTQTAAPETAVASSDTNDADADDLDADDEDYSDLPQDHPKVQRLMKRLRKLDRWAKKHRPVVQRVRDLDVDDLVATSRNYQAVMERLNADPDLLQRFVSPAKPADRQPSSAAPQRPVYTPLEFAPPPFDPSDDAGRYIVGLQSALQDMHKQLHETRYGIGQALRDVLQWRKGIDDERGQASSQRQTSSWKAAIAKVQTDYDEDGAALVQREAEHLFEWARRSGRQDVLANPAGAIAKVTAGLKGLSRFKKQTQAAAAALTTQTSAAAALRTAAKPAAFTGGTPAPARAVKRETVQSVTRRLLGRSA